MVTVEARLIKLEAYEARLQKLEVYADEDAKDLEDRLKKVEYAIKEIPGDLVEHWNEMIAKVKKMHHEDKERKEALQAIWKKLQGIQEHMEVERYKFVENCSAERRRGS